jgi:HAD superfamily hydrolase (TIGR01490 family)
VIDKAVLKALRALLHECEREAESGKRAGAVPAARCPLPAARSLAFFDLDGTMVRGHMIFDFPAHLRCAGLFQSVQYEAVLRMRTAFSSGKLTYRDVAEELPRLYAEGVKGQKTAAVALEAEKFVENRMGGVFPYARPLVMLMREHGRPGLAISGSPIETVRALSRRLGMEAALGTRLKTRNGVYTGKVAQNFIIGETKRAAFRQLVQKLRLDTSACFGFGDTEQDESFLSLVGHPVCLNPSAGLRAIALKKSWPMFSRAQDVAAKVKRLAVRADAV